MKVTFWGVRGAIVTPGRDTKKYGGNTSCVEVTTNKANTIILDAGTGLFQLGRRLPEEKLENYEVSLFMSHTHWDHIQGFPFFEPILRPTTTATIYGPKKEAISLREVFARQMANSYFPVDMTQLPAELAFVELEEESFEVNGVHVFTKRLKHPGGVLAYKMVENGSILIYAPDNELYWKGDITRGLPLDSYLTSVVDYIREADLLIYDCQYRDEEYPYKPLWGHSSLTPLLHVAHYAKVKKLVLFHHDPSRSDLEIDKMVEEANEKSTHVEVIAGRERTTIVV
jgi:phosphoribosyl 1,2-cyclic phosphodiesterase